MDLGGGEGEDEDAEVEDGKKVNQVKDPVHVPIITPLAQVLATEPILVPCSNSKVTDDLDFLEVQPSVEDIFEHLFNQGSSLGYSSEEEEDIMAPEQRVLGKKESRRGRAHELNWRSVNRPVIPVG